MTTPKNIPDEHYVPHRHVGGWLPVDNRVQHEWVKKTVEHVAKNKKDFHPAVQELKELIEGNTRLYLLFSSMFTEIPRKPPYDKDPAGTGQILDYYHMLELLNHVLTEAPRWSDAEHRADLVGLPIFALFDWPMATPSGFAAFLDPQVNAALKKVLNAWGEYLQSSDSAKCLDDSDSGWFGRSGRESMIATANQASGTSFETFDQIFKCDPSAPYHGFKSWDDFFTRQIRPEARPVASPDDDSVIANACESRPYALQHKVKARDRFWIKGARYGVRDLLDGDPLAEEFMHGSVYQAFLSALSYHRWHTPVSGKIVKTRLVDGTYFSEPLFEDFTETQGGDPGGIVHAQSYIAHTATRGLIFIEADNPAIGLMCVVQIGMDEVSSVDITVEEGQHVRKGDELGRFHFGGSTHCLVFRKDVKLAGFPEPGRETNVPVRSELARVQS